MELEADDDLLVAYGVDGDTGDYLLPPIPSKLIAGRP